MYFEIDSLIGYAECGDLLCEEVLLGCLDVPLPSDVTKEELLSHIKTNNYSDFKELPETWR